MLTGGTEETGDEDTERVGGTPLPAKTGADDKGVETIGDTGFCGTE